MKTKQKEKKKHPNETIMKEKNPYPPKKKTDENLYINNITKRKREEKKSKSIYFRTMFPSINVSCSKHPLGYPFRSTNHRSLQASRTQCFKEFRSQMPIQSKFLATLTHLSITLPPSIFPSIPKGLSINCIAYEFTPRLQGG